MWGIKILFSLCGGYLPSSWGGKESACTFSLKENKKVGALEETKTNLTKLQNYRHLLQSKVQVLMSEEVLVWSKSLVLFPKISFHFKHVKLVGYIADIFSWQRGPQMSCAYVQCRVLWSVNDSMQSWIRSLCTCMQSLNSSVVCWEHLISPQITTPQAHSTMLITWISHCWEEWGEDERKPVNFVFNAILSLVCVPYIGAEPFFQLDGSWGYAFAFFFLTSTCLLGRLQQEQR